jgi:two-component system, NtrC family, sensor kinase
MSDRLTEMLGVLAHEMRTPIAAILGYQELLADGIFGKVDPRGQEPLARIAYSAKQLLNLIDGVQEVMLPPEQRLETNPELFDPVPVLRSCIQNAITDAQGRNVELAGEVADELPHIDADPVRFCRAIDLALAAAIKTSYGATLQVAAHASDGKLEILIANTALRPGRDDPPQDALQAPDGPKLTGAGLRLAIVRHLVAQMSGNVKLEPAGTATTLVLELPGFHNSDSAA